MADDKKIIAREALNNLFVEKRAESIRMREESGIEQIWREDEAAYEANYSEIDEWRTKPPGRIAIGVDKKGSRVGYNITSTYCNTAASSIGDMLFPSNDKPWAVEPTVIPDLINIAEGKIPKTMDVPPEKQQDFVQAAQDEMAMAAEKARRAEKRIEDWLEECQFVAQCRLVIDDCAKIGTGVIKGPYPNRVKKAVSVNGQLKIEERTTPSSSRISYWNAFPDLNAGEDIQQGNYFFERDEITGRQLESLLGGTYLDDEIIAALKEGPHKATKNYQDHLSYKNMGIAPKKGAYEIWYGYTFLGRHQLQEAGFDFKGDPDKTENVYACMVNGRLIKATQNIMSQGSFPYDLLPWERRIGLPWGIGVARQIRTPQRIVDAAIRNLMNNAGLAGGPMIAIAKGLRPMNGKHEIVPLKMWELDPERGIDDLRKAVQYITLDMMQNDLNAIIDRALKMAEDITGLPMLLQGQQGAAPETVGGMTLLLNNSSMFRRRIARSVDDHLTTPHIRRYYDFILEHGEEEEKGDMQIKARGSSAMVERDLQNQNLVNLLQFFLDPRYGKDPRKAMDELLKSQKFDTAQFDYDDEEWQQMIENWQTILQQGEQDDTRLQVEQLRQQGKQAQMQFMGQMETMKQDFEIQKLQAVQQFDAIVHQMKVENDQRIAAGQAELKAVEIQERLTSATNKIKAELAMNTQKLELQKKLSDTAVATPAAEPAGRAPDGQSFAK